MEIGRWHSEPSANTFSQQQSLRYWRELFENYLHASQEVLVIVHDVPKPKGMEDWLPRGLAVRGMIAASKPWHIHELTLCPTHTTRNTSQLAMHMVCLDGLD